MNTAHANRYLALRDVARRLGVDVGTARAWVQRGDLPAVRLPGERGAYRVHELDLALALRPATGRPTTLAGAKAR